MGRCCMAKESKVPLDWFKKAEVDLKSAKILLDNEILETAAFHIQQAIEKYLKGYLLSKGWKLIRTHDLISLLNDAVSRESHFEAFRELCVRATEYYIEDRYPFLISSQLSVEELEEIREETKVFANFVKKEAGRPK